ncbi:MAG: asparaginase domain-containing protein, partial [Pseudomonadota bacterium]
MENSSCARLLLIALVTLIGALGLVWLPLHSAARAADAEVPEVLIIATGGTIAGVQDDPNDPSRYRAGSLSAAEIMASVPELVKYARIDTLQFSNVPSTEIKPRDWVRLSTLITRSLQEREDLAGVVITHGTDRLEETAFFL